MFQAMYDTVYHHKTVRCMEGMIAMLLRRLRDEVMRIEPPQSPIIDPIFKTMRGEALELSEVLALDDFALFVLIETVASGAFPDDTARDLASRIQARDLLKIVPVPSDRINEFVTSQENMSELHRVVQQHVAGLAKYYVLIDRSSFRMLSKSPGQEAMLLDSQNQATRAADHDLLYKYRGPEQIQFRLFTVAGAVDQARRLIEGTRTRALR